MGDVELAKMAASTYVFVVGFLAINLADFFTESRVIRERPALYNSTTDCVVVFDNLTLDNSIYDSPKSWVVEFYSSWCGHCVHFAPIYKEFAEDITGRLWLVVVPVFKQKT